eukprot:CAMPEP_0172688800 /NCGR_PEP_ID=MMETSP1074-20121228/22675_1 /TAXON_ID=2916 /ORGANISM="Ceratium fusus, Strain PA161109" /LENGTH=126 /DNA_ID=CAMNT_0013508509 /DNA_START=8 /DNA_END=385 /DNA_ORIENTATION=+
MSPAATLTLEPLTRSASRDSDGASSAHTCSTAASTVSRSSCSDNAKRNANIHSFGHHQLHQAHQAAALKVGAKSQRADLPDASPPGPILADGEIVALVDRTACENNTFRAGDIGQGNWQEDGSVRI